MEKENVCGWFDASSHLGAWHCAFLTMQLHVLAAMLVVEHGIEREVVMSTTGEIFGIPAK